MFPLIPLNNLWHIVTQAGIVQSGEDPVMHGRGSYFRIMGRSDHCGLGRYEEPTNYGLTKPIS